MSIPGGTAASERLASLRSARQISAEPPSRPPLLGVARLAFWLGLLGFGGGYAVLSQLRAIVVDKRRWQSEDEYADAVSVAVSLPGANAANYFTLLGLRAAGPSGALLVTVLFLLPSFALMVVFGATYDRLHDLPRVQAAFAGMNPAVVAIIAAVALGLLRQNHRWWQLAVAAGALAAIELGVGVLEVVLVAVVLALSVRWLRQPRLPPLVVAPLIVLLPKLITVFLRIGLSSVAGGLAMIPMLDHEIVEQLHWLTPAEFSDAVTLGQITPGPVAITATFIGYRLAGLAGALLATVATFSPPLVANVVAGRSMEAFRGSRAVANLLAVLSPVTTGIVISAALSVGRASLHGWTDCTVAGATFVAIAFLRLPPLAALVLAAVVGGVLGF